MSGNSIFYNDQDYKFKPASTMLYGQDVVDGYKKLLKETVEECAKLRNENFNLQNQVRQLKAVRRPGGRGGGTQL